MSRSRGVCVAGAGVFGSPGAAPAAGWLGKLWMLPGVSKTPPRPHLLLAFPPHRLAALGHDDLVAARVVLDVVHEGLDEQQAAAADAAEVGRVGRVGQQAGVE